MVPTNFLPFPNVGKILGGKGYDLSKESKIW
jgi:hypothetical protein